MLRARALAKVGRIAAHTHEYVAPKIGHAAVSASSKLAHWRERDLATTAGGGGGEREAYAVRQPKRAARAPAAANQPREWGRADPQPPPPPPPPPPPRAAAIGPSSAGARGGDAQSTHSSATTSTTSTARSLATEPLAAAARKWTASGLGSYLSLSSFTAFSGSGSSTAADHESSTGASSSATSSAGHGAKGKGKGSGDDLDEDRILCFPGVRQSAVSMRSWRS